MCSGMSVNKSSVKIGISMKIIPHMIRHWRIDCKCFLQDDGQIYAQVSQMAAGDTTVGFRPWSMAGSLTGFYVPLLLGPQDVFIPKEPSSAFFSSDVVWVMGGNPLWFFKNKKTDQQTETLLVHPRYVPVINFASLFVCFLVFLV